MKHRSKPIESITIVHVTPALTAAHDSFTDSTSLLFDRHQKAITKF
ncbi:hypothetical protein [Phormidesmis priestleyi]